MLRKVTPALLLCTTLIIGGRPVSAQYLDDYRRPVPLYEKPVVAPVSIPPRHLHALVDVGEITTRGELQEEPVREEIEKHHLQYRYCYESALVLNPTIRAGKSVINAVTNTSGSLDYEKKILYKSDITSFALEQCLKSTAWGWRFTGSGRNGSVTVTLAFAAVSAETMKPTEHYLWKGEPLVSIGAIRTGGPSKTPFTSIIANGFASSSMVEQVVQSKLSGLEYCFLKGDFRGERKLELKFSILDDGTVSNMKIIEEPVMPREDLGPCAGRMLRRWKFPSGSAQSGTLEVYFASPVTINVGK